MKRLSKEVQLLLQMTELYANEDFDCPREGFLLLDSVLEEENQNHICVLTTKVFCYEYMIEQMVKSLNVQNIIRRRIKEKNIDIPFVHMKHYDAIKNCRNHIDFDKKDDFANFCDSFRKIRNKFVHDLLRQAEEEWIKEYQYLDEDYWNIYDIYADQDNNFINGVQAELNDVEKFLISEKDYSRDMEILKDLIVKIRKKEKFSLHDGFDIANLHQIYVVLEKHNAGDRKNNELWLRECLSEHSAYSFIGYLKDDFLKKNNIFDNELEEIVSAAICELD